MINLILLCYSPVHVGCIIEEFYEQFSVLLTPGQNVCHIFNNQNPNQNKNGKNVIKFFSPISYLTQIA